MHIPLQPVEASAEKGGDFCLPLVPIPVVQHALGSKTFGKTIVLDPMIWSRGIRISRLSSRCFLLVNWLTCRLRCIHWPFSAFDDTGKERKGWNGGSNTSAKTGGPPGASPGLPAEPVRAKRNKSTLIQKRPAYKKKRVSFTERSLCIERESNNQFSDDLPIKADLTAASDSDDENEIQPLKSGVVFRRYGVEFLRSSSHLLLQHNRYR
eukprot:TCONS_00015162-protein